jgi:hypothetical protein
MADHPHCLNCGATFGTHDPDDSDGCPQWWPSTMEPTDG